MGKLVTSPPSHLKVSWVPCVGGQGRVRARGGTADGNMQQQVPGGDGTGAAACQG